MSFEKTTFLVDICKFTLPTIVDGEVSGIIAPVLFKRVSDVMLLLCGVMVADICCLIHFVPPDADEPDFVISNSDFRRSSVAKSLALSPRQSSARVSTTTTTANPMTATNSNIII